MWGLKSHMTHRAYDLWLRGPEATMNCRCGSRNGIVMAVEEVTRQGVKGVRDEMTLVKGFAKFCS